jgi:hypothetical protein
VLVRVVLVEKVVDALEQVLEPQQRAYALAQWILVADHAVDDLLVAARWPGLRQVFIITRKK